MLFSMYSVLFQVNKLYSNEKILLFLFKIRKKRFKNKQGIAYRRQIEGI